jgi:hypothetical protein
MSKNKMFSNRKNPYDIKIKHSILGQEESKIVKFNEIFGESLTMLDCQRHLGLTISGKGPI